MERTGLPFTFDDYGYATIKYGYDGNMNGMNWNLKDLIGFLNWHYFSWGGRVLFFGLFCLILKNGELAIQLFQAVTIIILNYLIYKNITEKRNDIKALIIVMIGWMSIGIMTAIDGIYWYTASAILCWPFVFIFAAFLLMKKYSDKVLGLLGASACFFIGAFSQEQISVMVMIYSACTIVVLFIKKNYIKLFPYFCGIVGGAICIAAPGNWNRSSLYSDFNNLSLFQKVITNLPGTMRVVFGLSNVARVICYILLVSIFIQITNKWWMKIIGVCQMLGLLGALGIERYSINIAMVLRLSFAVVIFVELLIYFLKRNNVDMLFIIIAAVMSIGMMLVSPVLAYRMGLPFSIVSIYFVGKVYYNEFGVLSKFNKRIFLCAAIIALMNYGIIMGGFYSNYKVNTENRRLLKVAAHEDKAAGTIVLHKLKNRIFASTMPYEEQRIEVWIKAYYGLPDDYQFVWED